MSLGLDQGLVKEIEARFGKTVTKLALGLFVVAFIAVCINLIVLYLIVPVSGFVSDAATLFANTNPTLFREAAVELAIEIAKFGLSVGLLWAVGRWIMNRWFASADRLIEKVHDAIIHVDATITAMRDFERKRATLIPATDDEGRARSAEIVKEAEALYAKAMDKAPSTGSLLGSLPPSAARRNSG